MKTLITLFIAIFCLSGVKAQGLYSNGPENPSIEAGLGMLITDPGYRFTVGAKDVFIHNRLGFYYTVEYRSNSGKSVYQKDIFGFTFSLHKYWAIRGGVGMFMDQGIFDGKYLGLRKEMSVTYQPSSWPVSFDLGYSISVGPTSTIRYVIPLK